MLLEHVAPVLDLVEESLQEGPRVDAEPRVEQIQALKLDHLVVNVLVRIDLENKQTNNKRSLK